MSMLSHINNLKDTQCIVDTLRGLVSDNECARCGKCVFGYEGVTQLQLILGDIAEKKGKSTGSRFRTEALEQELERTGVALEAVLERYHIHDIREMTSDMYQDAMKGLKKSKSRVA